MSRNKNITSGYRAVHGEQVSLLKRYAHIIEAQRVSSYDEDLVLSSSTGTVRVSGTLTAESINFDAITATNESLVLSSSATSDIVASGTLDVLEGISASFVVASGQSLFLSSSTSDVIISGNLVLTGTLSASDTITSVAESLILSSSNSTSVFSGALVVIDDSVIFTVDGRAAQENGETAEVNIKGARNASNNSYAEINFVNYDDSGTSAEFEGISLKAEEAGYDSARLGIFTALSGTASRIMTIAQNKNVGIGVADPAPDSDANSLHINGNILLANSEADKYIVGNRDLTIMAERSLIFVADSNDTAGAGATDIVFGYGTDSSKFGDTYANYGTLPRVETMRIESATGDVGIGTNNPGARLDLYDNTATYVFSVHNDGNNSNRYGCKILAGLDAPASNGDCRWFVLKDGDNTDRSYIEYSTSSPFATFVAASDASLKKNINPTRKNGLDIIKRIPLFEFDWVDSKLPSQAIGYVAQECELVYPEMVHDLKDGTKGVSDACLIPLLVQSIQQLLKRIEDLEKKI